MQPANGFAFKEWAVICAALGSGRQSLIVRKGGIGEGREGFRVEHPEFFLFPTYVHQIEPSQLTPDGQLLLGEVLAHRPPPDSIELAHYAVVEQVFDVRDETRLPCLEGLHLWSHHTLGDRFHYRQPGLFILAVRIYRLPAAVRIPDSPHFAGCRTWVDLPAEISTAGAEPVLSEAAFNRQLNAIQLALESPGFA